MLEFEDGRVCSHFRVNIRTLEGCWSVRFCDQNATTRSRGRRRSLNLLIVHDSQEPYLPYSFIAALDNYHRHFHIVHLIDLPKHILETGIERHSSHPAVGRQEGEEVQMLAPDSTHLFSMSFRIRLSTELQSSPDLVGLETSALVSASCFSRPFRT